MYHTSCRHKFLCLYISTNNEQKKKIQQHKKQQITFPNTKRMPTSATEVKNVVLFF